MTKHILFINDGQSFDAIDLISNALSREEGYELHCFHVEGIFVDSPIVKGDNLSHFTRKESVTSFDQLNDILSTYDKKNSIIFSMGWPRRSSRKLFQLYNELNLKWVKFNFLPFLGSRKDAMLTTFKNIISTKIYEMKHGVSLNPTASTSVGQISDTIHSWFGFRKTWKLHSLDYENYLGDNRPTATNHIVYLDQNLFMHPDFDRYNIKPEFNKKQYLNYLTNTLQHIESVYQLPVLIALHPTSDEDFYKGIIPNHNLVKNKTHDLVRNSKIVVGHYSTALSYGVIYCKPIFLVRPPIQNKHITSATLKIKRNLKLEFYDKKLEKRVEDEGSLSCNPRVYNKYIHNYICINQDGRRLGEKLVSNLEAVI